MKTMLFGIAAYYMREKEKKKNQHTSRSIFYLLESEPEAGEGRGCGRKD